MQYTYYSDGRIPVVLDSEVVEEAALILADASSPAECKRLIRALVRPPHKFVCVCHEAKRLLLENDLEWPFGHPMRGK